MNDRSDVPMMLDALPRRHPLCPMRLNEKIISDFIYSFI